VAEKPLGVPRGLFATDDRAARDQADAIDLSRAVEEPRTGSLFLSLVNRLSNLEAAVRQERLARLEATGQLEGVETVGAALQIEVDRLKFEIEQLEIVKAGAARVIGEYRQATVAEQLLIPGHFGNAIAAAILNLERLI